MPDQGASIPFIDPNDPGSWANMQYKQLVADQLMRSLGSTGQTPQDWDAMRVVPRRSIATNLSPLVGALMARRGVQGALNAQQRYYGGLFSPPGGAPSGDGGGAPAAASTLPQTPNTQGQIPSPPSPAGASPWLPMPDARSVSSIPIAGMSPQYQQYRAFTAANPAQYSQSVREAQEKIAQQQYAPQIQRIHGAALSTYPLGAIQSDPNLRYEWAVGAASHGWNPALEGSDFTPTKARQALGERANAYRAGLNQPEVPLPQHWTQANVGYGGTQQTEDVTGETKPGLPRELPKTELTSGGTDLQGHPIMIPHVTSGFAANTPGIPAAPGAPPAPSTKQVRAPSVPQAPKAPAVVTSPGYNPEMLGEPARVASAFATQAATGDNALTGMENRGIGLSLRARTGILNALESGSAGGVVGAIGGSLGSEYMRQRAEQYMSSPEEKEYYLAGLPVLEARARQLSSSGTRGLSPEQMRMAFDEVFAVPGEPPTGVQKNRAGLVRALTTQAGPAMAPQPPAGPPARHPADIEALVAKYKSKKGQQSVQQP